MAYIGREPQIGNFQVCDAISVVNGQAAYTMQVSSVNVSPETANHMIVSLNGVLQKPGSSFTVSGSTITFASNLVTGDVIDFIHILGSVLDLGVPSDSTVSLAKLTATGTKDATTFLRGDNTFAEAGGGNTPYFQGRLNANQSISNGSGTIMQLTAAIDTASGWDSSSYKWTVPSGQAGNYFVSVVVDGQSSSSNNTSWVNCSVKKNSDVALVNSDNKSMTSNAGGRHIMTNSCSGIVALSVGDEVYFSGTVYINSGTAQFNGSSSVVVTGGTIFKLS